MLFEYRWSFFAFVMIISLNASPGVLFAQTNPTAQPIPYSQDFGSGFFSTLPAGFAAWNSSPSPCSSVAIAATSTGISDQTVDTAVVPKANGDIYGYSGLPGGVPNNDGQLYIQTSSNGTQGSCQLVLAINTTGYSAIYAAYDIIMVNPQPKPQGVVFQYRVGTSGAFTTISNSYVQSSTTRVQFQVDNFLLPLGAGADNQPVIQLRWSTSRATTPAGNSTGIAIDNIFVNGTFGVLAPMFYRSIASGNWNDLSIWESSPNNVTWSPALRYPGNTDNIVTIQSPHKVSTAGIPSLVIDETVVEAGATLWNAMGTALVINDGPGAIDLDVSGTFEDSSSTSVVWVSTSRWRLGANGNLVKATNSASKGWQVQYYNGIANIPSTSNWICRKPSGYTYEPVLSSTNNGPPNPQACYGNLYIENNANSWTPGNNCRFNGLSNFPIVKGNLYIGGNGTGTVVFPNVNTNATPVLVMGDLIIKAGCILQNQGTGFEIQGNIINNGIIDYVPSVSRLLFSGSNSQSISGTGSIVAYNFKINKPANHLTVNNPVLIDGGLELNNGKIFTASGYPFIINDNALVIGASNLSFVSGPVTKKGDDAFTFPVGKNTDLQTAAISSGPARLPFWTEAFENGCLSNCLAAGYAGPNGTWLQTITGTNGAQANIWYVSSRECGNSAGSCQSQCAGDGCLHISSGLSTILDSGAIYSNGVSGPLINMQTNKRIQSPTINCTGRYDIMIEFNYLEGGSGLDDNCVLMYFNGLTWSPFVDLNKTNAGACPAGSSWTNFRVNLPSSANNNPNVKIGFQWLNNADGVGLNPSFAVDDITLTDMSDAFTAEYFGSDPQVIYGGNTAAPLDHVSHCEYWSLLRSFGNAGKNVTLTWDANSCGVTNLPTMRVAKFSTPSWIDQGNILTTGNTAAGAVTSNLLSSFGIFTLSSTNSDNPLPISLLYFDALYNGKDVDVSWTTMSEINNDFFTVQRSANGIGFDYLTKVDGAGTSFSPVDYAAKDYDPLNGISYYRLMQTDFNGNNSYSGAVAVRINSKGFDIQSINHSADQQGMESIVILPYEGTAHVSVVDMLGRIIYKRTMTLQTGANLLHIPELVMNKGLYIMRLVFDDQQVTKKFLY
jgi:hypothetical protein